MPWQTLTSPLPTLIKNSELKRRCKLFVDKYNERINPTSGLCGQKGGRAHCHYGCQ